MNKKGAILWDAFEGILKFVILKVLHIKIQEDTWQKFLQFIKFAMVGLSNAIFLYGIYLVFFPVSGCENLAQYGLSRCPGDWVCIEYLLVVLLEP